MKKALFLLFIIYCCSVSNRSFATHLMGGDITVYNDSDTTYTLTLQLYRDVLGIPLGVNAQVDVFMYDATSNSYLPNTSYQITENTALSTSLLPYFPYGVEVGIFTQDITLSPGKYMFVYNTSARNNAILNATSPGGESLVLYTYLEVFGTAANSSPSCLTMPIAYFALNSAGYYNPAPYDADGDSLTWALDSSIGNPGSGYPTSVQFTPVVGLTLPPSASTGPFSINSVTGEITWTPNTMGNFIQAFNIDEYRAGVKIGTIHRDMQYVVVTDSTADSIAMIPNSACMYNPQFNYNYQYYTPGQAFSVQINGLASNTGATLTMNAFGSIFMGSNPATFTTSGTGNNITGTLHWTPPANLSKDVIVVFRLSTDKFMRDYTLLLRKNPAVQPSNVAGIQQNANTVQVFPNPVQHNMQVALSLSNDINSDISLYSVIGQKVASVYSGKMQKGTYKLEQEINVAPGTYFLVVKDNGKLINTQQVIVE